MEVTLTVRKLDEGAGGWISTQMDGKGTRSEAVTSERLTVFCEVLGWIDHKIDQFANLHGPEPALSARSSNALVDEMARQRMDSVRYDFVCYR